MEERKVPGKNELRKREPVIQVKNLYKVYRVGETKVYALNGVDFTMYRGEFCAIVGTSGSGKSTLLNMLAGLEKPTKGEIVIAGQHIEKLNENQLVAFRRERVGFIFQSYNLLGTMNAVENVALPLSFRGVPRGRRREMAEKYLKMVGLEKARRSYAEPDVRRAAAACRHCTGAGGTSRDHFCRRADGKSGFAHDDGCAETDAADRPGTEPDAGYGHA